jgi:hypothetical protein
MSYPKIRIPDRKEDSSSKDAETATGSVLVRNPWAEIEEEEGRTMARKTV